MTIRALVVDDTIVYRKIVSDALSALPDVVVVGSAADGAIALKKLEQTPADLVLCDVYMPNMNGVETAAAIRERFPRTIVVMMSGISTRNAEITIRALEEGAIDFIRKPDGGSAQESMAQLVRELESVLRLVKIRLNTIQTRAGENAAQASSAAATAAALSPVAPASKPVPSSFGVLAIGVSTGGPEALSRLIPALPALPVPVVLVQHMPAGFTKSLAESLGKKSKLRVVEAAEGDAIEAATVYIAPGGRHMTVRRGEGEKVVVALNDGPPENSCRPAVDVLFRSVADVYASKGILAAILTGMGSDGCNGVRAMKRKGCLCISQQASSCVVYGMPRAVDEAGLSDVSLPIEGIAPEICRRLRIAPQ